MGAEMIAIAAEGDHGRIYISPDKEQIIAISGGPKKDFFEKQISDALEKTINSRSTVNAKRDDSEFVQITDNEKENVYNHELITPIIAEGDALGAVIFLSPAKQMGEIENKLAQSAAGFLAKQMEQ